MAGHEVVANEPGPAGPVPGAPGLGPGRAGAGRREAEDGATTFGSRVAALRPDRGGRPRVLQRALGPPVARSPGPVGSYLLHCGTIWVHGSAVEVPVAEDEARQPFGDYGTQKAAIEELLLGAAHQGRLRCTVLRPGHIVGPGWAPVNPAGNLNLEVFNRLARGDELALPNLGLETVHHVHADDVAQGFAQALSRSRRCFRRGVPPGLGAVPSPCAATPRAWPPGSGKAPGCRSNPGRPGRAPGSPRMLKPRGTTSLTVLR